MGLKHDIRDMSDIQIMVDAFYAAIREDELLGPIFNGVIQDRWPTHLEKMYRFWQSILLNENTYHGSSFDPHAKLPIEKTHFERWQSLFSATVDAHFAGPKADEAKDRAHKIGMIFNYKIDYLRSEKAS